MIKVVLIILAVWIVIASLVVYALARVQARDELSRRGD